MTLEVKRAGERMAVVTAAAATATQGGWSVEAASWGPVAETAKQEGWSVETVNQEGRAVRVARVAAAEAAGIVAVAVARTEAAGIVAVAVARAALEEGKGALVLRMGWSAAKTAAAAAAKTAAATVVAPLVVAALAGGQPSSSARWSSPHPGCCCRSWSRSLPSWSWSQRQLPQPPRPGHSRTRQQAPHLIRARQQLRPNHSVRVPAAMAAEQAALPLQSQCPSLCSRQSHRRQSRSRGQSQIRKPQARRSQSPSRTRPNRSAACGGPVWLTEQPRFGPTPVPRLEIGGECGMRDAQPVFLVGCRLQAHCPESSPQVKALAPRNRAVACPPGCPKEL